MRAAWTPPRPAEYARSEAPRARAVTVPGVPDVGGVLADRREAYEYLPADDATWQCALDAQRTLARSGRHRAVGIADMVTAVLVAEHGVTVLHYDGDFEIAAEVLDFDDLHPDAVPSRPSAGPAPGG